MAEVIEDTTYGSAAAGKPKKCPNCNHLNPSTATTCRKCKKPLAENVKAIRCPVCQCDVLETDDKCSFCGLPIEEVKAKAQIGFTTHGDNSIAIEDEEKKDK